jgi:hypothetical protein
MKGSRAEAQFDALPMPNLAFRIESNYAMPSPASP